TCILNVMTLGRWAGAYDIVADCFLLTSKRQDLGVRSLCVESGEGVREGVREESRSLHPSPRTRRPLHNLSSVLGTGRRPQADPERRLLGSEGGPSSGPPAAARASE
ncbi:MAG: hypothetical protein ACK55I_50350, partial [bacterium]